MPFVTVKEFAEIKGVTAPAVREAIKAGRLVNSVQYNKNGKCPKIDPVVAMQEWEANTRHDKRHNGKDRRPKPQRAQPYINPDVPPTADGAASDDPSKMAYREALRMQKEFQAKTAELEFKTKSGFYIESTKVRAEAFKLGRTVRDSLLNIPDRVAAEFAGIQTAAEIHMRLTDELRMALEALNLAEQSPEALADG